jgi:metallo-beta-lactamase family protein
VSVTIHFHGASGGVTGSCFRIRTARAQVLVDCGMFQGPKTEKALNYEPFPFDARAIAAVLLTHAHIDHSGLLPKLFKAGFAGAIHATAPTRALGEIMLADAAAIQEMEVETLNRRAEQRGGRRLEPIYTRKDAAATMGLFRSVAFGAWTGIAEGMRARYWRAGHILGAASIELEIDDEDRGAPLRLLFSGDLGPRYNEILPPPEGPMGVDHLVMESTYGAVARPPIDLKGRRAALAAEIRQAIAAGGPLLIPAFAIERTQEVLIDLLDLIETDQAPPAPIFLDSPLAIRACDVFFAQGGGNAPTNPFAKLRERGWLRFTESPDESREIERFRGWHVIIAASGMCDAGRVRHHLKRLLWRPEATVLMVGYQAVGTLGRLLLEGRKDVRIQGEPFRVRANVRNLDVYSAHADGADLVAWAKARAPSGDIFLVHGERDSAQGLERRLIEAGFDRGQLVRPALDQAFRLTARAQAEPSAGLPRIEPDAVARLDWHNRRAEFLSELNRALGQAPDDAARGALIDRLRSTLAGAV